MDINGSTEVVFDNYDPENIKFLVSFDFVGAICILANSFHNCIIYTVRSPRFKVISGSDVGGLNVRTALSLSGRIDSVFESEQDPSRIRTVESTILERIKVVDF